MSVCCRTFLPIGAKAEAESIIFTIISDVIQECKRKRENILEPLAAFMVKAVLINKDNGFAENKLLSAGDVAKLKEICINRLVDTDDPTLDTIKMQVYFDLNYTVRDVLIREHKHIVSSRLKSIITQLCGKIANTSPELQKCYRTLISGILIYSGVGSPTRIAVIREATAALQKVLPVSQMSMFITLTPEERVMRFKELTDVVTGMRLYNYSLGFGGEGIDNLPELVESGVAETLNTINTELKEVERLAALYTSLYLKLSAFDIGTETMPNMAAIEAGKLTVNRALLMAATINTRQHAAYLRHLRLDVFEAGKIHTTQKAKLVEILGETLAAVKTEQDATSKTVQTLFSNLSKSWSNIRDNLVFLSMITNLLNGLQAFGIQRQIRLAESTMRQLIHESEITWDHMRAGFCAWSIVRYQGLPVPCTPSIGIFHFKGKHYGFSSVEAATEFDALSEKFTFEIGEIARKNPELIELLGLQSMFENGNAFFPDRLTIAESKRVVDTGMQTLLHPVPSHIDNLYSWNEWELRRRALQLVYIRRCVTHSMQTNLSNWRRDNVSQVWLPKDVGVQTKRDNYSQVPTPSVFAHGLRGGGGVDAAVGTADAIAANPYSNWCKVYRLTDPLKVDLTVPVEDHFCGSINGPDRPMH